MAATTVNGHLRTLKTLLGDHGIDAAKRVQPLEEDDTRITDDEPNLLTPEELKRFLKAARELYPEERRVGRKIVTRAETHYPMILMLLTTGARISTVRAVRWEDLDPEAGVVHFRRRWSKREVLPGVKRSRTSKDMAGLLPELYALLEARRAKFNE